MVWDSCTTVHKDKSDNDLFIESKNKKKRKKQIRDKRRKKKTRRQQKHKWEDKRQKGAECYKTISLLMKTRTDK